MLQDRFKQDYKTLAEEGYKNLREYQREGIDKITGLMSTNPGEGIFRQNYTGTGKSVEQNYLAFNWLAQSSDHIYLFLIHRDELLENAADYFRRKGVYFSFIKTGSKTNWNLPIFLASVGYICPKKSKKTGVETNPRIEELKKLVEEKGKKLLIICDETHHATATTWSKVLSQFPTAQKIGFSANVERLDGKGFNTVFSHLIEGKPYKYYVDNGYLAPFKLIIPEQQVDMALSGKNQDKLNEQQEQVNKEEILGYATEVWKEFTYGQKTVVFCPGVETSENVVRLYNELGQKLFGRDIAAHVDGKTDKNLRKDTLRRFSLPADHPEGLLILSNVELFLEGVNVPSCAVTQWLRYTHSEIYYDQGNGRSNRPAEGKTQYIIDHVGNFFKHGLPDRERVFSLKGRKQLREEEKYKLTCLNCSSIIHQDYRELQQASIKEQDCPCCNSTVMIPVPSLKKKSATPDSNKKVSFIDTKFTVLGSEHYDQLSRVVLFKKYENLTNRAFFNMIVKHLNPNDLAHGMSVLNDAADYRSLPRSYATAAYSQLLSRMNNAA